uniref:Reticulophagy regulator family member 3 n=1 Tax=Lates calcarifer TaxID=8187 RepID=A0A4W6CQG8_LATCA
MTRGPVRILIGLLRSQKNRLRHIVSFRGELDRASSERDSQVRAVKAALQSRLGPYEPVLTYLQSVLVWERPFQCLLLYTVVNVVFWFFALTSLRLLFLLASALAVVVCVDTWRNKIWPEIRGATNHSSVVCDCNKCTYIIRTDRT